MCVHATRSCMQIVCLCDSSHWIKKLKNHNTSGGAEDVAASAAEEETKLNQTKLELTWLGQTQDIFCLSVCLSVVAAKTCRVVCVCVCCATKHDQHLAYFEASKWREQVNRENRQKVSRSQPETRQRLASFHLLALDQPERRLVGVAAVVARQLLQLKHTKEPKLKSFLCQKKDFCLCLKLLCLKFYLKVAL